MAGQEANKMVHAALVVFAVRSCAGCAGYTVLIGQAGPPPPTSSHW